jgi:hypothetical protein
MEVDIRLLGFKKEGGVEGRKFVINCLFMGMIPECKKLPTMFLLDNAASVSCSKCSTHVMKSIDQSRLLGRVLASSNSL